MMTKTMVSAAIKIAGSRATMVAPNKTTHYLSDLGIGHTVSGKYMINEAQRKQLRDWLKHEHDIDWSKGTAPLSGSRTEVSLNAINGKLSGSTITKNWAKLKPLAHGHLIRVDGCTLPSKPGMHLEGHIDGMTAVDCDVIMLVENLETFNDIDQLQSVQNDTHLNKRVLVIYRGDPSAQAGTRLFKLLKARMPHKIYIAFCDYDPAGLRIALSSGAQYAILPVVNELTELKGDKVDFSRQYEQLQHLVKMPVADEQLAVHVNYLKHRKASFTQERLFARKIKFELIPLP